MLEDRVSLFLDGKGIPGRKPLEVTCPSLNRVTRRVVHYGCPYLTCYSIIDVGLALLSLRRRLPLGGQLSSYGRRSKKGVTSHWS